MRWVVVAAAALLALATCFIKPDGPMGASVTGDGGMTDGRSNGTDAATDATGTGCTGPSDDMTSTAMLCGNWGSADVAGSNARLFRTGSVLESTVAASGSHADCFTVQNFDFAQGVSIEMKTVLSTFVGDTTRFTVTLPGGSLTIQTQLMSSGLQVSASCTGPGGFSLPTQYTADYRFLKFSVLSGTSVSASRSANGINWNVMGSCSVGSAVGSASIRFGTTAGSGGGDRTAEFDDLKTCTTTP